MRSCQFCQEPVRNVDMVDCESCGAVACRSCASEGRCSDCVERAQRMAVWREQIIEQAERGVGFFDLTIDYGLHRITTTIIRDGASICSPGNPFRCEVCGETWDQDLHYEHELAEQSCPDIDDVVTYRVPAAPFQHWALRRTYGEHLASAWTPICPPDLKMMNDDRYHTDFMVGAGLPLVYPFAERHRQAISRNALVRQMGKLQREILGFQATVLSGRGLVHDGECVHPDPGEDVPAGSIVVIGSAGPEHTIAALTAAETGGAVITERGGPLSHLAVVGSELGLLLVQIRDARSLYPVGCRVLVDGRDGCVEINNYRH